MIIEERPYTKDEYEGLAKELIQSPDLKEEFRYKDSLLIHNRLFFPRLFKAIDKIKNEAMLSNNQRLVSDLGDLETGLMEHTNIFPSNLPDVILGDKRLTNDLLSDNQKIGRDNMEWLDFKNKIFEQSEILPPDQYREFLEWCLAMLQMNWERHEKTCRNPNCPEEATYQKRMAFLKNMIEDLTPQEPEPLTMLLNQIPQDSGLRLTDRKGARIDLIRVANAMYELGFFRDEDGLKPPKKSVMKAFGSLFQVDLSEYDKDLSQAFQNANIEPNIKIFKDLEEITKTKILELKT